MPGHGWLPPAVQASLGLRSTWMCLPVSGLFSVTYFFHPLKYSWLSFHILWGWETTRPLDFPFIADHCRGVGLQIVSHNKVPHCIETTHKFCDSREAWLIHFWRSSFGVSSSAFIWALRVELRSANLFCKCFCTMSHLTGLLVCVCVLIFYAVLWQTQCVAANDLQFLILPGTKITGVLCHGCSVPILIHLSLGVYRLISWPVFVPQWVWVCRCPLVCCSSAARTGCKGALWLEALGVV